MIMEDGTFHYATAKTDKGHICEIRSHTDNELNGNTNNTLQAYIHEYTGEVFTVILLLSGIFSIINIHL